MQLPPSLRRLALAAGLLGLAACSGGSVVPMDSGRADIAPVDAADAADDAAPADAPPADTAPPGCRTDADCAAPNATARCMLPAGRCAIACAEGFADCDGSPANGCEVNLATDAMHCGTCATVCTGGTNAMAACVRGVCGLACSAGTGDCDGTTTNGCETNTQINTSHCGACGRPCVAGRNSTATCAAGRCGITCGAGFADCDGDPANGCEADTQGDPAHCGGCARACPVGPNATARCDAATCGIDCARGFGDCDRNPANGCETSLATSDNCGACRVTCQDDTPACAPVGVTHACTPGCAAGLARCTGACVNTQTDPAHCGACGAACTAPANAMRTCAAGRCGFACALGFADCDGDPANGCEVNTTTDARHCGGCGRACPSGACISSSCAPNRSCAEVRNAMPLAPSGRYMIDPDGRGGDAPIEVYCDMATAGGGWTLIYVPTTTNHNATTVDYTVVSPQLMALATQALLAYRDASESVVGDWARFDLPAAWRVQSPFRYQAEDASVSVVVAGRPPVTAMLRYGYATWPTNLCSDPWNTAGNYGRLCIVGTTAPYYNSYASTTNDYCSVSNGDWNATLCSPTRRFTIAVR